MLMVMECPVEQVYSCSSQDERYDGFHGTEYIFMLVQPCFTACLAVVCSHTDDETQYRVGKGSAECVNQTVKLPLLTAACTLPNERKCR